MTDAPSKGGWFLVAMRTPILWTGICISATWIGVRWTCRVVFLVGKWIYCTLCWIPGLQHALAAASRGGRFCAALIKRRVWNPLRNFIERRQTLRRALDYKTLQRHQNRRLVSTSAAPLYHPRPTHDNGQYGQFNPFLHVMGPDNPNNTIRKRVGDQEPTSIPKWGLIQSQLKALISALETNPRQLPHLGAKLKAVMKSYNPSTSQKANYELLDHLDQVAPNNHLAPVLISIAGAALRFPTLFPGPVPLLRQGTSGTIWLTAEQAHCILANAFFCTFPKRGREYELYENYPDINFFNLYQNTNHAAMATKVEKLKCLMHYFEMKVGNMATESMLSFERKCIERKIEWSACQDSLGQLVVSSEGAIETARGSLQVDFANKFVGGGVLGNGAVMEEILFVARPELIVSRLFTEALADDEVLVVTGTTQYAAHSGYKGSFKFCGNYVDVAPQDNARRKCVEIVAMDALHFQRFRKFDQFEPANVERELNKCYSAFAEGGTRDRGSALPPVASGNWGCGAFNGDFQLKALIQLMAASVTKRPLLLYTFQNTVEAEALIDIYARLKEGGVRVGQLVQIIELYRQSMQIPTHTQTSLFSFIGAKTFS